jgi:hypothetical protein
VKIFEGPLPFLDFFLVLRRITFVCEKAIKEFAPVKISRNNRKSNNQRHSKSKEITTK